MNVKLDCTKPHQTREGYVDERWVLSIDGKQYFEATRPRDLVLLAIAMKLGVEVAVHEPPELDKDLGLSS